MRLAMGITGLLAAVLGVVSLRIAYDMRTRYPVLHCPETLQLGECEGGEHVVARFRMANHGRGQLVVDNFGSSCACAGLEREVNGRFLSVSSLKLDPGQEANLAMRLAVPAARSGQGLRIRTSFRTNDPNRQNARIDCLVSNVTSGISATPNHVAFGVLPMGRSMRQTLEIRDRALEKRTISHVVSSRPDWVQVKVLPFSSAGLERTDPDLIATLEVVVQAKEPGLVREAIEVHLNGPQRNPDLVEVTGRIVPLVEATPSTLALPRQSGAGLLYSGTCFVRSHQQKEINVEVQRAPDGIRVRIARADGEVRAWRVDIDLDATRMKDLMKKGLEKIQLRVWIDAVEQVIEIPVFILPGNGHGLETSTGI